MAKERQKNTDLIEGLAGAAQRAVERGLPPVHLWNPPFCGDLDIRIAADGTWHYLGSPITRPGLVKLFASVLKRENDNYYLVTPVEKVGIRVDDAPFVAVEMEVEDPAGEPVLTFRTNVDDRVICDADHPLRFDREKSSGGLKPYLHVRRNLWAKLTRALLFDLVARGEERDIGGQRMFGVASGDQFFAMADAHSLEAFT
jgi:hypothetical protein